MKTQISIDRRGARRLVPVFPLLLALAVVPAMLRAQAPDPTGAWLIKWYFPFAPLGPQPFVLAVFHEGGTFTGDVQGESATDPHTFNGTERSDKSKGSKTGMGLNVIASPQSGEWQMTGDNTFVARFMVIEYEVQTNPASAPLFELSKLEYTGTLEPDGTMTLDVALTHYDENGKVIQFEDDPPFDTLEFQATGVRVEDWPSTPIPTPVP